MLLPICEGASGETRRGERKEGREGNRHKTKEACEGKLLMQRAERVEREMQNGANWVGEGGLGGWLCKLCYL